MQDIWGESRRKETTRKTKINGWIILKWILERERMGWYGLDQSG
jgi:hypothetical protein